MPRISVFPPLAVVHAGEKTPVQLVGLAKFPFELKVTVVAWDGCEIKHNEAAGGNAQYPFYALCVYPQCYSLLYPTSR